MTSQDLPTTETTQPVRPPQPTELHPTALEDLKDVRRSLQDAGITLLQAATAAISAAAKETLSATTAVIGAAEDTLAAAEEKIQKLRADLRNRS